MLKRIMTPANSKRALSLLLCLALLLSAAPVCVLAANPTSGTCGANLTWSYNTSTATLTISGTGEMEEYASESDGFAHITGAPWWQYRDTITTIVINSGVTSVGSGAFYRCTGLTSATIENSVTSIGGYAFARCTELTSVTIGSGVTSIGNSAFSGCSALTSITIPDSVTSIGEWAFYNCNMMTSATIGSSVTNIGNVAFANCASLTSVTIGRSVTSIGSSAFSGCAGLTDVYIHDLAAWCRISFSSYSSNPLCYARKLYLNGALATNLVIPDSVTSIGDYAFFNCTGLSSVTVPSGVTSIGLRAFNRVANVVYYGWASGSPWGARAVNGYVEAPFVYSDLSKRDLLACPSSYQGEIAVPNTVTNISRYAFYNCTGLTSVTIPNSVTIISSHAFDGCTGLTSVIIPDSVTSIGDGAFYNCTGLTSVTIPDSVTSIGYDAFYGCTGLTSVTIPNSVTRIDSSAFYGCTGLTSVIIPNSVTSIGSSAFSGCTGLTSVIIPNSVTSIDGQAFDNCSNNLVIFGDSGSYAETYANENGITFLPISAMTFTLTYDANGGTGAPAAQTGNGTVTLSSVQPTRTGYTFQSWNTKADGTGVSYVPGASFNLTANSTLYAQWKLPDYIPGDINDDGNVNNKDLTRLLKYLSGENVTVVEQALDVNGDGSVNNKDLTRLLKYVSGENVEIH